MHFQVNDSKTVIVRAAEKWSAKPLITVEKGEKFLFTTSKGDKWYDMGIPASAKGYFNPLLKIWSKRVPDGRCFELCGTIDPTETGHFRIGAEAVEVIMPESGDLYFFANDNIHFYWNNWGSLTVKVTRLA